MGVRGLDIDWHGDHLGMVQQVGGQALNIKTVLVYQLNGNIWLTALVNLLENRIVNKYSGHSNRD